MAIRTTADLVDDIVEVDTTVSLTAFIRAASLIVDQVEACAIEKGDPLTADELKEIETWLAAHFYTVRDPRYASKSTLRASGAFQLDSSYLDVAKLLDHSGCLAAMAAEDGPLSARMLWLGRPPSEQTDYEDRD